MCDRRSVATRIFSIFSRCPAASARATESASRRRSVSASRSSVNCLRSMSPAERTSRSRRRPDNKADCASKVARASPRALAASASAASSCSSDGTRCSSSATRALSRLRRSSISPRVGNKPSDSVAASRRSLWTRARASDAAVKAASLASRRFCSSDSRERADCCSVCAIRTASSRTANSDFEVSALLRASSSAAPVAPPPATPMRHPVVVKRSPSGVTATRRGSLMTASTAAVQSLT